MQAGTFHAQASSYHMTPLILRHAVAALPIRCLLPFHMFINITDSAQSLPCPRLAQAADDKFITVVQAGSVAEPEVQ